MAEKYSSVRRVKTIVGEVVVVVVCSTRICWSTSGLLFYAWDVILSSVLLPHCGLVLSSHRVSTVFNVSSRLLINFVLGGVVSSTRFPRFSSFSGLYRLIPKFSGFSLCNNLGDMAAAVLFSDFFWFAEFLQSPPLRTGGCLWVGHPVLFYQQISVVQSLELRCYC